MITRHRLLLAAVAASALLGGCGTMHRYHHGSDGPGPMGGAQHRNPQVLVDGKTVSVQPPILLFGPGDRKVDITWRLPEGPYYFAERGIEIEGEIIDQLVRTDGGKAVRLNPDQKEIGDCRVLDGGKAYTCHNLRSRPGIYKYTVRVTDRKSPPIVVDPPVVNW